MIGPDVIARTLGQARPFGKDGTEWQYHPRSDHHSKLACWAIAVDLLATSSLLRQHSAAGMVTIGVNHTMTDFRSRRRKDLDLVIARPGPAVNTRRTLPSLAAIATRTGVVLTESEQAVVAALPDVAPHPAGAVLVALEAKACMTEHAKSEPRLFDELNSSQQTVHGAADQAIAVGLAMVNIADSFVSPGRQAQWPVVQVTRHNQPSVTASVVAKVRELPRRTAPGTDGFDALGVLVVSLRNDGSPVTVWAGAPAPRPGDGDTYAEMILRTAALYDYRFASL